MSDDNYSKEIASIIVSQMGGMNRLKATINARNFFCGTISYNGFNQPYVQFSFSLNPKITKCRIIYEEGKDTYVMQFLNRVNSVVKEYEDVYCDELIANFEQTTGLYLKLF